jgi:hypothetical protein
MALDPAKFAQSLNKGVKPCALACLSAPAEKADYWQRRLLPARRKRPRRRAAKRANECSSLDVNCHPTLRRGHACNGGNAITLRLRRLRLLTLHSGMPGTPAQT